NPAIIINSNGYPVITWQDNTLGYYTIAAAQYGSDIIIETPVASVPITITGSKKYGLNPVIYKFQQQFSTDLLGQYFFNDMEWDTYALSVDVGSGFTVVTTEPPQPLQLDPNEEKVITIILE